MIRSTPCGPVLALFACLVLFASPGHAQTPPPEGAASGRVIESATSRGIMGAFLRAFDAEGEIVGRGFSGQDGFFTVTLPAGGPYRLEVQSMGFGLAVADSLRIPATDTLRIAPIELVPDSVRTPSTPDGEEVVSPRP